MYNFNPLYRGVYAEQFERWFRVFDRSQVRRFLSHGSENIRVRDINNVQSQSVALYTKPLAGSPHVIRYGGGIPPVFTTEYEPLALVSLYLTSSKHVRRLLWGAA